MIFSVRLYVLLSAILMVSCLTQCSNSADDTDHQDHSTDKNQSAVEPIDDRKTDKVVSNEPEIQFYASLEEALKEHDLKTTNNIDFLKTIGGKYYSAYAVKRSETDTVFEVCDQINYTELKQSKHQGYMVYEWHGMHDSEVRQVIDGFPTSKGFVLVCQSLTYFTGKRDTNHYEWRPDSVLVNKHGYVVFEKLKSSDNIVIKNCDDDHVG